MSANTAAAQSTKKPEWIPSSSLDWTRLDSRSSSKSSGTSSTITRSTLPRTSSRLRLNAAKTRRSSSSIAGAISANHARKIRPGMIRATMPMPTMTASSTSAMASRR